MARAVMMLLEDEEWSKKSDRWIADRCGVGGDLVLKLKAQLEPPFNGGSPTAVGRDGKERKMPAPGGDHAAT